MARVTVRRAAGPAASTHNLATHSWTHLCAIGLRAILARQNRTCAIEQGLPWFLLLLQMHK
jgi:hypothetical protein